MLWSPLLLPRGKRGERGRTNVHICVRNYFLPGNISGCIFVHLWMRFYTFWETFLYILMAQTAFPQDIQEEPVPDFICSVKTNSCNLLAAAEYHEWGLASGPDDIIGKEKGRDLLLSSSASICWKGFPTAKKHFFLGRFSSKCSMIQISRSVCWRNENNAQGFLGMQLVSFWLSSAEVPVLVQV